MKTKELTMLEESVCYNVRHFLMKIDKRCEKATIAKKVQLVSILEFAELPKTMKIDKEEFEKFLKEKAESLYWYVKDKKMPDEINTNTLYVGWYYQEGTKKYAVCFRNERFDNRSTELIMKDLAREYLIEKLMQGKGFITQIMDLTAGSKRTVIESILAEIRNFYLDEQDIEQSIINKAVELGIEEKVIKICLNVERKNHQNMINFLESFWDKGTLLEDKVKEYLKEVGAM